MTTIEKLRNARNADINSRQKCPRYIYIAYISENLSKWANKIKSKRFGERDEDEKSMQN